MFGLQNISALRQILYFSIQHKKHSLKCQGFNILDKYSILVAKLCLYYLILSVSVLFHYI